MRGASWTKATITEVLSRGRWFGDLDAAFQHDLVDAGRVRALAAGERLFSRGDAGDGLYAMLDGVVRVAAVTNEGKELLLTRVEAPTWFGEIAVFDRQVRTHDCIADGEAAVLHVPTKDIDTLLEKDARRYRDLGVLVANKLRITFTILEDAAHPLPVRIARRLLVLAEGHGEHDKALRTVRLTQEQLASMVSVSRQSGNAALKELESKGLVRVAYGVIELRDVPGLRALIGA